MMININNNNLFKNTRFFLNNEFGNFGVFFFFIKFNAQLISNLRFQFNLESILFVSIQWIVKEIEFVNSLKYFHVMKSDLRK